MFKSRERRTVRFSGRVQGVGFRASTEQLAGGFAVTGYVRNLADGRVETIVEGESDEVVAFLVEVRSRLERYIREVVQVTDPATGEFLEFSIRY